ncbi:hypothetical protein C8Q80DRAFT_1191372, partial [Daedaleopsis nitida]
MGRGSAVKKGEVGGREMWTEARSALAGIFSREAGGPPSREGGEMRLRSRVGHPLAFFASCR